MNEREYRAWVKTIVLKPVLKRWAPVADVLHRGMLDTMLMAQCMTIVIGWDKHRIDQGDVVKLVRTANALLDEYRGEA